MEALIGKGLRRMESSFQQSYPQKLGMTLKTHSKQALKVKTACGLDALPGPIGVWEFFKG
ncbi:MAG: hypothetical protein WBC18_11675 [Ottowia sp.]|uniref:hypothetical protein n=1 Tax=Ottowia sp. TaxID=1898956 RepID=UPI003C7700ED